MKLNPSVPLSAVRRIQLGEFLPVSPIPIGLTARSGIDQLEFLNPNFNQYTTINPLV